MSSPPLSSDNHLITTADDPFDADELESRLTDLLDAVLSSRRTASQLAVDIEKLSRTQQDFILHWIAVIARTNAEMAFQFAVTAPGALAMLDSSAAEAWIIHAMDVFDREGLYRGSEVFKAAHEFSRSAHHDTAAVFDDVVHVLELFVQGLAGRRLRVESAPHAYTDTDTIYLPPRIAVHATTRENFLVYKAMTALLWAQSRFGTFSVDLHRVCEGFSDPARALTLLNALETVRLEARLAAALPGLAREIKPMRHAAQLDERCEPLLSPTATIGDSVSVLARCYDDPPLLEFPYATALHPAEATAARSARIERDRARLQAALAHLLESDAANAGADTQNRFTIESAQESTVDAPLNITLKLDGEALPMPPDLTHLVESLLHDLGDLPDEYLVPAHGADGAPHTFDDAHPDDVSKSIADGRAFFYNEWDHQRGHYRKNWCALREIDIDPGDADFVARTLAKYRPHVSHLKHTFELLRGEERTLRRQPEGDSIDLEALIEAYSDMREGTELTSLLFTRRHRVERDLAVMFMVDMSGSTKGWVNDAEREALVMLCEALEVLGDRYAIYGFSGMTRTRCEIYRIKRFGEAYGSDVRERIAGIQPQDYTRMGAAIRHLTMRLNEVEARTKLLVTLSDGKPDDYSDNYRGEYGIEDTRKALIEAHQSGIKPFCITIDREGRDYLPHMYGAVNWTLIDDVTRLPVKVASIYRRLTS